MHRSVVGAFCIDVPAAGRDDEVDFWSAALGRSARPGVHHPEFSVLESPHHVDVLVQALGEDAARVHLNIHTDNLVAEVGRLSALGARTLTSFDEWVVMEDPAGLVFCVVAVGPDAPILVTAMTWEN